MQLQDLRFGVGLSLVAVVTLAGCAAGPRGRPLPTERIEEGPNSTAAVRKQFEGRWSLVSFTVSGPDGDSSSDQDIDTAGTEADEEKADPGPDLHDAPPPAGRPAIDRHR